LTLLGYNALQPYTYTCNTKRVETLISKTQKPQ
jgi:hypothetical protein